jgi:excisionase family DNA binding protein
MLRMLENKWITITEAAAIIGCSTAHLRFLAISEKIKSTKVGPRLWLIDKKAAEKMAKTPAKTGRPRSGKIF